MYNVCVYDVAMLHYKDVSYSIVVYLLVVRCMCEIKFFFVRQKNFPSFLGLMHLSKHYEYNVDKSAEYKFAGRDNIRKTRTIIIIRKMCSIPKYMILQ